MLKFKTVSLALLASTMFAAQASAFCLVACEPKPEDARKVFENRLKTLYSPDFKIQNFEVTRFWRIDVEGAGHKGVEFYFKSKVEFPKGANLDCKPAADGAVKEGCSAESYFSTTERVVKVKGRQYIEPGRVIDFDDETRFDQHDQGWKGQDGVFY